MPNEVLLQPLAGDDPCGRDLRWDPDFMAADQLLEGMPLQEDMSAVQGEEVFQDSQIGELEAKVDSLVARTRDMRVMAIRAELAWRRGGLTEFATAMEDAIALAERWPDPGTGFHPRADEEDGDLDERSASLGKLLNRMPQLAATLAWGDKEPPLDARHEAATILRGIFEHWTTRLEAAFGAKIPPRDTVWPAIRKLIGEAQLTGTESEEEGDSMSMLPGGSVDAWDLVERAVEAMSQQDKHSPALPILKMLLNWRSADILDIVELQRNSGVTLEQLLESARNQISPRT